MMYVNRKRKERLLGFLNCRDFKESFRLFLLSLRLVIFLNFFISLSDNEINS